MIKFVLCCLLLAQVANQNSLTPSESKQLLDLKAEAEKRWEKDIKGLEEMDQKQQDRPNSILFIGSSSIRLWESMAEDMAPWPTIRRGYGGAKFSDLVVFTERLTKNHDYRALVVFVANDITGGADDKTPEQVLGLYQLLVKLARSNHPDKPIFFIAITANSKRFHVWDKISSANRLIKEYCESDPKLHFIATEKYYLNEQGTPRDELFIEDKLHQNRAGYRLWASIIKPALQSKLGSPDASLAP
ncbi:MAG: GDSL-type esterase/lipase family protein [Pirellulales bacterium]